MWHNLPSPRFSAYLSVLAAVLAVGAEPATAQAASQNSLRLEPLEHDLQTVLPMGEVGETLQVTAGHSRFLRGEAPFGTIIVGDDTIAGASPGPGDSIILTGLAAGSTNLIVLDENQRAVLSATIAVVPVAGPLRSTVTVLKGSEMRETYECRSKACQRTDADDEQRERPFVLVAAPDAVQTQAAPE